MNMDQVSAQQVVHEPSSDWLVRARFGVLVHFGLSSVLGNQAWAASTLRLSAADLDAVALSFEPDLLQMKEWVERIANSGAQYVLLTVKHHDGFCLWPSKYSDFSVARSMPMRDIVNEFVTAARRAGLRIGLFYSLPDWHHSDFTIDQYHPLRDHPDAAVMNATRNMDRFRADMRGQLTELLTHYGTIDYLFFDFSYPGGSEDGRWPGKGRADWGSDELFDLIRRVSPSTIVNSHADLPGAVVNPERHIPINSPSKPDSHWEVCLIPSGSWGYDTAVTRVKTAGQLIRFLIETVASGGILQLHISADGRGRLAHYDSAALADISEWMNLHVDSIVGCSPSSYDAPSGVRFTQHGDRLYAHLLSWPERFVHLPGLAHQIVRARFLHDNSILRLRTFAGAPVSNDYPIVTDPTLLSVELPEIQPDVAVPVIELKLDG